MLRLGLPSKGRIQDWTLDWLAARGVEVRLTGNDREYAGEIAGIDAALVLLSAGEVPRELAAGRIHAGVTGLDLIRERLAGREALVSVAASLGFAEADLVIAVPEAWVDCTTLDDLDDVAGRFRAVHGRPLRIATKYHALTRAFLRRHGVADYRLIDSQGATEGTVANGTAEAIADITTTGSTLRANRLRILEDGLVLRSEAVLALSHSADWSAARPALRAFAARAGLDLPDALAAG